MCKVLVLDASDAYWEVMKEDYERHGIVITSCDPAKGLATKDHLKNLAQFDVVLLHDGMHAGSAVTKLNNYIFGGSLQPPGTAIPAIILENHHEDLKAAKVKWNELSDWFNIKDIQPMSDELPRAIKTAKDSPSEIDPRIKNLPFPARILDKNRQFVSQNVLWNWASDRPGFEAFSEKEVAFTIPFSESTKEKIHKTGYWLLRGEKQSDGQFLQIAHQHIPNNRTSIKKNIKFLWQLLLEIGFSKMRFYLVQESPDSLGVIEFHSMFPDHDIDTKEVLKNADEKGVTYWETSPNKYSAPVDDIIDGNFKSLLAKQQDQHNKSEVEKKLIHETFKNSDSSPVANFFRKLAGVNNEEKSVYIPIFANGSKKIIALAALDFEKGKETIITEALKRRSSVVLERLRVLRQQFKQKHEKQTNAEQNEARSFLRDNMPNKHTEEERNKLVNALLNECLVKSPYDFAGLAWKSHSLAAPTILALAQKNDKGQNGMTGADVSKKHHPALAYAMEEGEPIFLHNGIPERKKNDRNKDKGFPRFALPLSFAGNTLGAIVFRTNHGKVRFLQSDIERIKTCMDICGPVLYLVNASIATEQAKLRLQHDVRSGLSHAIRELSKENANIAKTTWYLQHLQDSAGQFEATKTEMPSIEISSTDIVEKQVEWVDQVASDFGKKITYKNTVTNGGPITGNIDNFKFIIRTLLSNALAHSDKSAPMANQNVEVNLDETGKGFAFSVTSQANNTSQEELDNAFKFGATNEGNRRTDGSHFALSLSRDFAKFFSGTINLGFIKTDTEAKKVRATFTWKSNQ